MLDEGGITTQYEGFGPDGKSAQLRDTFSPVEGEGFRSVTYVLRKGQWRQVLEDHWRRVD